MTGIAGVGKSRLAAAALAAVELPVLTVDLAETPDLPGVWNAVLGDSEGDPRGWRSVADHFGAERAVLLLDNGDRVAGELAGELPELLACCPNLTVVVTSRRSLALYQECLYQVPPLPTASTPDPGGPSPAAQLLLNSIETRFRSASAAMEPAIAEEIAAELGGVPLALELAATAVGRIGAERTLLQIRSGQPLPPSPFVDIPLRHRTIRDCVEWGITDLSRAATNLLLQISSSEVLADLEEVLQISGRWRDVVTEGLTQLVNHSLLDHVVAGNGKQTYTISGFTRTYCRQVLRADTGRAQCVRAVRADGICQLGTEIARLLAQPHGRAAAVPLADRWLPDLLATVHYLIEAGSGERAVRLLWELEDVWIERRMLIYAETLLAGLLSGADATVATACRDLLGRWALRSGRFHDAVGLLAAAGESGDPGLARCLALAYHEIGKPELARPLLAAAPLDAERPAGEREVGELIEALVELDGAQGDDEGWPALRDRAMALPHSRDRLGMLGALGRTLLRAQAPQHALEVFHLVLRAPDPEQHLIELVTALEGCARAYHAAGQEYSEQVHRISAAAHWIRDTYALPQLTDHVDAAKSPADSADPAISTIGSVLDIDEAVAYALSAPALAADDCDSPISRLTKRQLEIALLVADGMTNRMIASRLGIAEWTVVNHLRQVMAKLDCPSRLHVALVIKRGAQRTA
ncbi:LuxR C-terminal-related transcriptional regulator [Nocardia inohanensis]|uniref:LuxR C-terminal-related transcriptional regulator n=1 Tax=Nocardia inohanensis TaxID=209246 RepID=UPI00083337D5|nr:LuxR C-terminal-related transcriptional regulator [Nocardia inohanensis]